MLLRMQEHIDEEPRRWTWVFEEEADLKREKPTLMVTLKMPESWIDKVKK